MVTLEEIKKEHEEIERELLELEEITNANSLNYPNLTHVLNKICTMWDNHEKKESMLFPKLKEEGYEIPIESLIFQHKELRTHFNIINNALKSGNEYEIKKSLEFNGKKIISKLREHKKFEDQILDIIPNDLIINIENH